MLGRKFQNKGTSGWTGKSSFVMEVPLRYLRPSIICSVQCLLHHLHSLNTCVNITTPSKNMFKLIFYIVLGASVVMAEISLSLETTGWQFI